MYLFQNKKTGIQQHKSLLNYLHIQLYLIRVQLYTSSNQEHMIELCSLPNSHEGKSLHIYVLYYQQKYFMMEGNLKHIFS